MEIPISKAYWAKIYDLIGRGVVRSICTYELMGLDSDLPTFTKLVHTYRHKRECQIIVGAIFLWLGYHLLFEPSQYTYKFKLMSALTGEEESYDSEST